MSNKPTGTMYWICNFGGFFGSPNFRRAENHRRGFDVLYVLSPQSVFNDNLQSMNHLQYMNGSIFKMMSSPETRKPTRKPMVLSPKNVVGRLGTDSFSSSLRQWEYHLPHLAPCDRDSVFEGSCREPF